MRATSLLLCLLALTPLAACETAPRGPSRASQSYAMPVAEVQQGLTRLGFQPGPVDGLYGPQTRRAIVDYQRMRNLPATGRIDERFAASLRADLGGLGSPRVAAGTGAPGATGADEPVASPMPAPEPEVARAPLPDLVYGDAGQDPSLVAATGTPEAQLAKVRVAKADLDGDGDLDAVWNNTGSAYCGNAGCSFEVWFREGDGWRLVARLLALEVDAGAGRTQGVRDLLVTGPRGSSVWTWNGSRYTPAG